MNYFYRTYISIVALLCLFVSYVIYVGVQDANFRLAQYRFNSEMGQFQIALERALESGGGPVSSPSGIDELSSLDLSGILLASLESRDSSQLQVRLLALSPNRPPLIVWELEAADGLDLAAAAKMIVPIRGPGDRSLRLEVTPTDAYLGRFHLLNSTLVLTVSLAAIAAVLVFLIIIAKRTRDVQKLAEERTAQLNSANQKLQMLSLTDALTGLVNRRGFDQTLDTEWNRAIRDKNALTLLIIDVDHFKAYNDCYGHLAGDACLADVAHAIGNVPFRLGDLVARYGGEEFALILPNTDDKDCMVAERCRQAVQNLQIRHEQSSTDKVVTVSVGSATLWPHREGDPRQLIKNADDALYKAKTSGRNRVMKFYEKKEAGAAIADADQPVSVTALERSSV